MIRKTPKGYFVVSHTGKNLGGPYKTRDKAQERLNEVEMFKHMKKKKSDRLNALEKLAQKLDIGYSSVMRTLRKEKDMDRQLTFQKIFKQVFDDAMDQELEHPENLALIAAMKAINFKAEDAS